MNLSPHQQQSTQQLLQSPITASGTSLNSSFILRKKINYLTKYNLTNLIRDLELNMRETTKCDVSVSYFSFSSPDMIGLRAKKSSSSKAFDEKEIDLDTKENSCCYDSVFVDESQKSFLNPEEEEKFKRTRSYLQNNLNRKFSYNQSDMQNNGIFEFLDDYDFGKDFSNLKQTKFSNLQNSLSRSENLVITMNVEYSTTGAVNTNTTGSTSLSASMSSSMSLTQSSYNRVPSFSGTTNSGASREQALVNSTQSISSSSATLTTSMTSSSSSNSSNNSATTMTSLANPNVMMKSVSSASGELDLSMSQSNSQALAALQLKRTFCYAIIHAKTRTIIFYCFTTESANYDSIKLFLEQTSETITQRYHLVNNTVLYKLGGLIGDNILNDLKKVRTTTLASCVQNSTNSDSMSSSDPYSVCLSESKVLNKPGMNTNPVSLNNPVLAGPKLSKSPTVHRQMRYKEANTSN